MQQRPSKKVIAPGTALHEPSNHYNAKTGASGKKSDKLRMILAFIMGGFFFWIMSALFSSTKTTAYVGQLRLEGGGHTHPAVKEPTICLSFGSPEMRKPAFPGHSNCLLYTEPSIAIGDLKVKLVGKPEDGRCVFHKGCKPPHAKYDEHLRQYGSDWPPTGYTMVGKERLENFRAAVEEVNRRGILGSIAEFGVWRGGAMVMAANVEKEYLELSGEQRPPRHLYLFDAYENTGQYDVASDFLGVTLEKVQANFNEYVVGYDADKIHYVKGLFDKSVKRWVDVPRDSEENTIAVFRLDCNFYSCYQDVMYALYENVPVGGIVIWDDVISYKSVNQFWQDFKSDYDLQEEFVQIDTNGGWFRKEQDIKLDHSKKRVVTG